MFCSIPFCAMTAMEQIFITLFKEEQIFLKDIYKLI